MRIGFIHPSWPGSEGTGATHTASKIVEILSEKGHELTIYCVNRPPEGIQSRLDAEIEYLQTNRVPHTNYALNRAICNRLEEFNQYDLVSSYLSPLIPAMDTVGKKTSARTLVTLNAYAGVCPKNDLLYMGTEDCDNNSPSRCLPCVAKTSGETDKHSWLYQTTSRLGNYGMLKSVDVTSLNIDRFHALSTHVKRTYSDFGFPGGQISIIPNPIDESFIHDHESDFSAPYELLYVGNLENHKGVGLLPQVMERLDRSELSFQLTIVGDGGMRSSLEKSVLDLGLSDSVDFRGHVAYEELPAIYANHDIFVYPGLWQEPFGRVFLEALGTETPVVATDVGAAGEILGAAGELVAPNASAIADRVLSLAHDGELPILSENARTEAERYNLERIGQEFETLYRSVVS